MSKREMKPHEVAEVLKSVHFIGTMATLIDVEIQNRIIDIKFKNPTTSNHVRKIRDGASQVYKDVAFQFKAKDRDHPPKF